MEIAKIEEIEVESMKLQLELYRQLVVIELAQEGKSDE